MRHLTLLPLLFVTACAGGGGWPSLAPRPIEGPVASAGPRCAAAPTPSCGPVPPVAAPALAAAPLSPPVAIDDVPAKLVVVDRDLTDAGARLAEQRTKSAAAAAAARGTPAGSETWKQAELELTALDRVGNQIGDLRDRLDKLAGTLAAASAGGADIAAPLATTGRLIARTTALQADYDSASAALR